MQKKDSIRTITYKLGNTIRTNILNCKDVANSIYVDKEVLFSLTTDLCDCEKSKFCNPHHKYIITGDLRIIENKKFRKILTKSPNYREPRSIGFSKTYFEIEQALEACIEKMSTKKQIRDISTCALERICFNYGKRKN